jgi:DNA-binding NarL/FixJ family response regulator
MNTHTITKVTRVLLADDHPLMREALRSAIEDENDMQVVGEAANGVEAVQLAQTINTDVIVMDLYMPGMDGLHAIAEIHARDPQAHILVLTSSIEENMVVLAVQAGVLGYALKDSQRTELLEAIRQVGAGKSYLPAEVAIKLANGVRRQSQATAAQPVEPLTDREIQVLKLIGQGKSNREIANVLTLTEGTVRTHVHNILGKLGLNNRNQAILYAIRQGIIRPDEIE